MPFDRTVHISIRSASWNTAGRFAHPFPSELNRLRQHSFHLPLMLLRLGMATTPLLSLALYTAPFWPVLRYLHVFSDDPDLRLLDAWREVDFHQKTLASDDFGVGMGLEVLCSHFPYVAQADGANFLRMAKQVGILENGPAIVPKRGPQKTPDFVFLTAAGQLHFVECKGSQSGTSGLRKAMGRDAGAAQKRSIAFRKRSLETTLVAQRLVTGLFIARHTAAQCSTVLVADPPADRPFFVTREASEGMIVDQIRRVHLARILLAAGMVRSAEAILDLGRHRRLRDDWPEGIRAAVASDRERARPLSGGWIGSSVDLRFPAPIELGDTLFAGARVEYGVDPTLIQILDEPAGPQTQLLVERYPQIVERFGIARSVGDHAVAEVILPNLHMARLKLLTPGQV